MSNNSMPDVNEKDWKLFRKRLPDWQEAYMDKLNREYMELLNSEGTPSDKFWALEERIREDKKANAVQADVRRSRMKIILANLLAEGAITLGDLDGFSDELKEQLTGFYEAIST